MAAVGKHRAEIARPSFAWAIACDMRRDLESPMFQKWPLSAMTRKETRLLSEAMGHINDARELVIRLQASLSERSKLEGEDHPDYERARALR